MFNKIKQLKKPHNILVNSVIFDKILQQYKKKNLKNHQLNYSVEHNMLMSIFIKKIHLNFNKMFKNYRNLYFQVFIYHKIRNQ